MQGTVEAVSTKFGKYGVLIDGTWYSSKPEYLKVKPEKGDVIEFDNGGKNYLNKVSIVSKTDAPVTSGAKKSGYSQLGVELGHAANLAMQLTMQHGLFDEDVFRAATKDIFLVMKDLREQAESWGSDSPPVAKGPESFEPRPAKSQKPQAAEIEDDDIDF